MIKPAGRIVDVTRYGSERSGSTGAMVALALGWTLALSGLIGTMSVILELDWYRALWVAILGGSLPLAMWMTRRVIASRRLRVIVPPPVLERRSHGNLTDNGWRPLRSIGSTAHDVTARTGALLADLIAIPCVRIFHGVHSGSASLPFISHAISAGRRLVLIESVAWPTGHYEARPNGQIYCDGTYIGQSVHPLIAAVRHWQELLPPSHQVSAMIVVYPAVEGGTVLSATAPNDLTWVLADNAVRDIRQRILEGHQSVSRNAIAALMAATGSQA